MKVTLYSYLTDLGLFFFASHIAIFSVAGGAPFYGAIILLVISTAIKLARDFNFIEQLLSVVPKTCGRDALQRLFARENAALFINGVFLLILCALTLLDIVFNFHAETLIQKILVATNGLGYGIANIQKSAELDGLWVLPRKKTVAGNLFASLRRPECISVYASFPASILASAFGTWLILPLLIPAFLLSLKSGIDELDNVFLSQPKRIIAARFCIALSNLVVGTVGFMDGRIGAGIGLYMFFIGNCIMGYRTYKIQNARTVPAA
ncbi:MAG: hypothetical protein SFW65_04725 [Alphaproteobacteria bacterium]|nr:hypothetical protein [Alphaproteobacteria bacterium]